MTSTQLIKDRLDQVVRDYPNNYHSEDLLCEVCDLILLICKTSESLMIHGSYLTTLVEIRQQIEQ